jgi:hypothetical protein
METRTAEIIPFQQGPFEPAASSMFKAFFVYEAGDELMDDMSYIVQFIGEVTNVKLARNYSDITCFIRELEPETISLDHKHLCAQGLDTLLPIILRNNVPVVFHLMRKHSDTGYLCIGVQFSNVNGDYYERLVPAIKNLIEKA